MSSQEAEPPKSVPYQSRQSQGTISIRDRNYHSGGYKVKLPNSEKAVIDPRKLTGYCLNQNHADAQHKAPVFKAALDLDVDNVEELKAALLNAVKSYDAIPDKANQYGQK